MIKMIAAMIAVLALPAFAQVEMQHETAEVAPHFFFDALNFKPDSGASRIDFYLQVPYDELEFIKSNGEYDAAYDVYLRFAKEGGDTAFSESWDESAVCPTFDETVNSTIVSATEKHFSIRPGTYSLLVSVTDSESNRTFSATKRIAVRDYANAAESISDIMLLRASRVIAGKHTIVPDIEGNVISTRDSFPVFYEVYFKHPGDSVFATTQIVSEKNKPIYLHSAWLKASGERILVFADIPKDSIPMGFYTLKVSLRRSDNNDAPVVAAASREFSIRFPDLPPTITDLDKAADEMLYVAGGQTIDSIKSAPNMFVKEKRFISFWQRYNPNPSSPKNPIMDRYFARVSYANQHFSSYFAGWRSDMGMVYILLGPPNSVDRHPFDIDAKPYEIWYYYQKNREFIFQDVTGFGDYRLLNPNSGGYPPPSSADFFGW